MGVLARHILWGCAGGGRVDIRGLHLGLITSLFVNRTVEYTGGMSDRLQRAYTLSASSCTLVTSGTLLRCTTAPGVGGNYTWRVTVDGGVSLPSVDTTSYARPIVTSIGDAGLLSPTQGGAAITLFGANFGTRPIVLPDPVTFHGHGKAVRPFPLPPCDAAFIFLACGWSVNGVTVSKRTPHR